MIVFHNICVWLLYIGWAHVLCALYIPEVRFGNVSTMEPIILSSVPHEKFQKVYRIYIYCIICSRHKTLKMKWDKYKFRQHQQGGGECKINCDGNLGEFILAL